MRAREGGEQEVEVLEGDEEGPARREVSGAWQARQAGSRLEELTRKMSRGAETNNREP